jgi:hypothetical protein
VFGQHRAPLPGNFDLRAFGGFTPFVVAELAAIHVVAAVIRLETSPCGVFVVTRRVVVLSGRLRGQQQEQSNNQMHHADITPILRFRFGAPFRYLSSEVCPFSDSPDCQSADVLLTRPIAEVHVSYRS